MKFDHIIFDCDGVLVDSEPLSMRADVELLAENGIMMTMAEAARRYVGFTFAEMVARVREEFGVMLPPDSAERKNERVLELYRSHLRVVDGVKEALRAISLPKSIASNSPRERVCAALSLAGIAHHFDDRVHAIEDVARGKPAPDLYFLALEVAGVEPWRCLVVEDSIAGVTAAAAAGCQVVGFTGTVHGDAAAHAAALRGAGAGVVIGHMADLQPLLMEAVAAE